MLTNECPRLIPVGDWNKYHLWPTVPGMRAYLAKSNKNGMADYGVIQRVGRRVLIDEAAFFRWVKAQQETGA